VSSSTFLSRLSAFILVASGFGCARSPAVEPQPVSLSLRTTRPFATLWLSTPVAIELATEHDTAAIEAADALYVGEIGLTGGRVKPAHVALIAAAQGATHFRVLSAGDELRVDILLYRVSRTRWEALPEALRPLPPLAPMVADAPNASL
jgi:hypothetical protein